MDKKKITSYITTGVFLLIIYGLTIGSLITEPKAYSAKERRPLQQRPQLTFSSLKSGEFGVKYEKYLTDQFLFRDDWIQIKTTTERMLGKQESNGVFFAKDGYLIEKLVEQDINKEQWEKNKRWLADFLNESEYLLGEGHVKAMLVPTASYILKDKLPPYASTYNQRKINEEMSKLLNPGILIDVNDHLLEKNTEQIYYHTDHHWTSLGAYYAYEKWAESVSINPKTLSDFKENVVKKDFYGTIYNKVNCKVSPDKITVFDDDNRYEVDINMGEKTLDGLYDYDQLNGDDPYSIFLGGNNAITQLRTENKNGRKLLVIKDSYAHSFVPMLANHFEEVILLDLRYLNIPVKGLFEEFQISDLLVLYNNSNIMSDRNLVKLLQ